jgi:AcrR family transcriptional regulator
MDAAFPPPHLPYAPVSPGSAGKPSKGEETRALILDAAVRQASVSGFEALTIGVLAERTGLSKSGLFAHFGSKEELQIATLDEAVRRYNQTAVLPALKVRRGLPRMRAFFDNWLSWTGRGQLASCPMMAAAAEFDSRDGPMREAIESHMKRLHLGLIKSVEMTVAMGEFKADTDAEQFAFELFGIVATCYRARNLFRDPRANERARIAFERLIQTALAPQADNSPSG